MDYEAKCVGFLLSEFSVLRSDCPAHKPGSNAVAAQKTDDTDEGITTQAAEHFLKTEALV